ncbi:integrase catalytic domain-containing protein [Nephila pilipes]|uniref:Integrase catalytic domain-containing protein n=1 Tax=Nephila pilipes TaxID=299642 RepID=A0A8X6PGM3_NEPPI|nr:integrase catalytic domain-containing protein [Nephila pilipes]
MGTDFTGAIHVKSNTGGFQKLHIILFTCVVTRAVQLELQSAHSLLDLSSYSNLRIGDIILVEGVSTPKLLCDIGRKSERIIGRDGLVRACIEQASKGKLRRAVQLLYP